MSPVNKILELRHVVRLAPESHIDTGVQHGHQLVATVQVVGARDVLPHDRATVVGREARPLDPPDEGRDLVEVRRDPLINRRERRPVRQALEVRVDDLSRVKVAHGPCVDTGVEILRVPSPHTERERVERGDLDAVGVPAHESDEPVPHGLDPGIRVREA
jgi:hypothetical protein